MKFPETDKSTVEKKVWPARKLLDNQFPKGKFKIFQPYPRDKILIFLK